MLDELKAKLSELKRGRKAAEKRRVRAGEEVEAFDTQITAMEVVLRQVYGVEPEDETPKPATPPMSAEQALELPSLAQAVREFVAQASGEFTVDEVRLYVKVVWPVLFSQIDDASYGGAVSRLVRQGVINVSKPGRGREMAVYVRAEPPNGRNLTVLEKPDDGNQPSPGDVSGAGDRS